MEDNTPRPSYQPPVIRFNARCFRCDRPMVSNPKDAYCANCYKAMALQKRRLARIKAEHEAENKKEKNP